MASSLYKARARLQNLEDRVSPCDEISEFLRATHKPPAWVAAMDSLRDLLSTEIERLRRTVAQIDRAPFRRNDLVWVWFGENQEWIAAVVDKVSDPNPVKQDIGLRISYTFAGSSAEYVMRTSRDWPHCRETVLPRDTDNPQPPPHPFTRPGGDDEG